METLDCGHSPTPDGIGSGRAYTADGNSMCSPCAEEEEREAIRTATNYFAYISDDNRTIISWTGAKLGTVTRRTVSQPRWGTYGPTRRHYVRVTDIYGNHWYGSGPVENGDYVRLHRMKGK